MLSPSLFLRGVAAAPPTSIVVNSRLRLPTKLNYAKGERKVIAVQRNDCCAEGWLSALEMPAA